MLATTTHIDFQSNNSLIGCGIDAESISRFASYSSTNNPLPMVFSEKELEHIRTLDDRPLGFCASFCCKEAFFKAVGVPINFTECELFYDPATSVFQPNISCSPDDLPGFIGCNVRFFHPQADELAAVLFLFGASSQ